MKRLNDIIMTMRPKQWIKNAFVFPALLFSKSFTDIMAVCLSILAFTLFCLASGAVYIINDVIDKKKDILHPRKCKRPIASGRLRVSDAVTAAVFIITIVLLFSAFLSPDFMWIIVLYILLMLLYSWKLKSAPLLDIIAISAGFVLRTMAGAVIIGVETSSWILLCTSALCLFLAANKRKVELEIMKECAPRYKAVLGVYTIDFLNQMITVFLSLSIILYAVYTYNTGIPFMIGTTAFVVYGLFRYQLLLISGRSGENIEVTVLGDKPLLINLILWGLSCLIIVLVFY